jgi:mRNA interferase MazF
LKPGDVCWIERPSAPGHEQSGRRPASVLQEDDYGGSLPLVIVAPLTSARSASRFAGTVEIELTDGDGLAKQSVALVFQIRAVDRTIVTNVIGEVDPGALAEVLEKLDSLLGRSPIAKAIDPA